MLALAEDAEANAELEGSSPCSTPTWDAYGEYPSIPAPRPDGYRPLRFGVEFRVPARATLRVRFEGRVDV